MKRKKRLNYFIMALGLLVVSMVMMPVMSVAWEPSKPITLIVGSSPGGGMDTTARYIANLLPDFLGRKQPVVVNNLPGAGNRIALNFVRRSKPDGHTIGCIEASRLTSLPAYGLIDFEPIKEFTILGGIWTAPSAALIIATHPAVRSSPSQTWEELKKVKKPVRIASYANEGEFGLVPIMEKLNIPYTIVPAYGGFSDARGGLLRGEADIVTGAATMVFLQYVKNGELAPLMVMAQDRYKGVPEIGIIGLETTPTVSELGLPEFGKLSENRSRLLYAPKKLPSDIENTLILALKKVTEDSRTKEWSKKTAIPMMWVDRKPFAELYSQGIGIYKQYGDIARKIGLVK